MFTTDILHSKIYTIYLDHMDIIIFSSIFIIFITIYTFILKLYYSNYITNLNDKLIII